ncbi:MAG: hypothetical protein MT490_15750 [Sphingomonas sp.]|uniref:hypothetical protein n=1 Tax=Sphingomonas sp. TaxID=28214 RepID=UPI00227332AA|nr:hypothetical protein [Sphingomonas sp.]MCX8477242.1 hypothetical protein [Sphingomonas sp.]
MQIEGHSQPLPGSPGQFHHSHARRHLEQTSGTVIKRGAFVVWTDPLEVLCNGTTIPLSPTEACLFRIVALRGRASYAAIDDALIAFGSKPATRPVVMLHIRRKFAALGYPDPFERLGNQGVRLRVTADETGSTATMIGLESNGARLPVPFGH